MIGFTLSHNFDQVKTTNINLIESNMSVAVHLILSPTEIIQNKPKVFRIEFKMQNTSFFCDMYQ